MNDAHGSSRLDRRRFLQLVSVAGLGMSARVAAGQGTPPAPPSAPATPAAPAPAAPPAPPRAADAPPSEDAKAIAGVLRRRYPEALDDKGWESVARDIDGDMGAGKRLRAAKLENADEPDVTFGA